MTDQAHGSQRDDPSPYETAIPDDAPGFVEVAVSHPTTPPAPEPATPGPQPVVGVSLVAAPAQQASQYQASPATGAAAQHYAPGPQGHPQLQQGLYTRLPEHPNALPVLVLGILGFVTGITGLVGLLLGSSAKREIRQGARYAWAGSLQTGYVLSIVSSILMTCVVLFCTLVVVAFIVGM